MRNVSDKNGRGNHNTHFVFSDFISENGAIHVAKYGAARQVSYYNTAHAHCMLNKSGYRHTHSECVILFFHVSSGYATVCQCYVVLYIASFVHIEVVYGRALFPHTCYCLVLYWVHDVIVCGMYAKLFVHYAVFLSFPILQHRRVLSTPFGKP